MQRIKTDKLTEYCLPGALLLSVLGKRQHSHVRFRQRGAGCHARLLGDVGFYFRPKTSVAERSLAVIR